jgi:hypothetical protein
LARFNGASGLVIILAPIPGSEVIEFPTTLLAKALATTLAPQGRLKGGAYRTEIGIVQLKAVIIA